MSETRPIHIDARAHYAQIIVGPGIIDDDLSNTVLCQHEWAALHTESDPRSPCGWIHVECLHCRLRDKVDGAAIQQLRLQKRK